MKIWQKYIRQDNNKGPRVTAALEEYYCYPPGDLLELGNEFPHGVSDLRHIIILKYD